MPSGYKRAGGLVFALTLAVAGSQAWGQQDNDLDFLFESDSRSDSRDPAPNETEAEAVPNNAENANGGEVAQPLEQTPSADQRSADAQAGAATETSSAAPRRSTSRLIEEIVVTAQKREQNLSEVPISVAAFSGELLDAKGINDALDLPKITPGLTVNTQIGYTSTFLRGVGSDAFLLGDPSVVTYIDDVYYPFALAAVQSFGNVKRIEVLKGPQGTLFGRNALGGAIKIQTREPNLEELEFSAQAGYKTHDDRNVRAYASLPLLDSLAVSAAGFIDDSEHHIDGRFTSDFIPLPREKNNGWRAKLLWSPLEWFDLRLGYYDLSQDGTGTLYALNTEPSALGRAVGIEPQEPYSGALNEPVNSLNDSQTAFGQMHFKTGWLDVKLYGSDQEIQVSNGADFDASPEPIAFFFLENGFSEVQTAELQFLSNDSTPLGEWVEWLVGAYYFRSTAGFDPAGLRGGSTSLESGQLFGQDIPEPLADQIRDIVGNLPVPSGDLSFVGVLDTESIAYFTQATIDFTDWFSLTLGLRFQREERVLTESSASAANADGSTTQTQSFSGENDPRFRDTERSLDPKVSLNFRPGWSFLGSQPLVFLSYQTASTTTTFNAVNLTDPPEQVDGSKITAFELGIKTRFWDDLVALNAAAFHYDFDNPQVQFISILAGGAVTFENAGGQRIRGVDFDSTIQLFPALTNGGLVATLGGAYLDTEYTSYENASGFDPQTGLLTQDNDFTGNPVVRAPEFTGTFGLLQTFTIPGGLLELGADYYYNSGYFYLAQATASVEEDAYNTVGARVSYLYEPWNLRITGFGSNLTNEEYNISRLPTDFGTMDARAPRAIYGVRMRYEF